MFGKHSAFKFGEDDVVSSCKNDYFKKGEDDVVPDLIRWCGSKLQTMTQQLHAENYGWLLSS